MRILNYWRGNIFYLRNWFPYIDLIVFCYKGLTVLHLVEPFKDSPLRLSEQFPSQSWRPMSPAWEWFWHDVWEKEKRISSTLKNAVKYKLWERKAINAIGSLEGKQKKENAVSYHTPESVNFVSWNCSLSTFFSIWTFCQEGISSHSLWDVDFRLWDSAHTYQRKKDYLFKIQSFMSRPFYFIYLFILFFDRGQGREKERERNINVWLPLVCPLLGTWLAAQACALTGNQTGDPLVHRLVGTQSTEPHQPGLDFFILNGIF